VASGPRAKLPLGEAFRTPEAKRRYTRRLFRTIAGRYDLITRLLSFGQDQRWKRLLIDGAVVRDGDRSLDLACGTGDLAFRLAEKGATVVGLDFTPRMIDLARAKPRGGGIHWIVGDMGRLPLSSGVFDIVTAGYGLRNVPDLPAAVDEICRVLKPGGVLRALDFDRPDAAPVRFLYLSYLTVVGSLLGFALHGDPDTYRYIPESIRRYPGARHVAELMENAGFEHVKVVPLLGGLMAIHVGRKAQAPGLEREAL
jgi:demethylmenaquinone methyltransferase/2-methoxy-6-polyprenyl-1,4-benzoquinol methylase